MSHAQALLQRGDHADALAIATALQQEAPDAPDTFQLLGMCFAEAGRTEQADEAFARAWRLAPDSDVVALNFASWLRSRKRLAQAIQVLGSAPPSARTSLPLGLMLLEHLDPAGARLAFERALGYEPASIQALHGLANALQALGDLAGARGILERLTGLAPGYAPAWVNLGTTLRLLGKLEWALDCLQRAIALGHDTPETMNAAHGLLQDLGRPDDALAGARALAERIPTFVAGHETLAHLLWERAGACERSVDALQDFRIAAASQPHHYALQIALVRTLLQARRAADALEWLQPLRVRWPDDPALDWLSAAALDALGNVDQAYALYTRAARHFASSRCDFLDAYARHAIRTGRIGLAHQCVRQALKLVPGDQEAWSLLSIIWRLENDPREFWLCDYERHIAEFEVDAPPGQGGQQNFLGALERCLMQLHQAAGEPMAQSVRNGSQTPGRLFGRRDRVLETAEHALRDAAERWLAQLPSDPRHPFLARRPRTVLFAGSWSVCLQSSGRHANHIHDEGWMSSAFYVALPEPVCRASEDDRAGWIQFGQPLETLDLDLSPRRMIRPRPGHVVLFPSYMWHGTVPFSGSEPRLTIAFDISPAR